MDKRLMPSGDGVDSNATAWRGVLQRFAEDTRQGRPGPDAAGMQALAEALGPLADDALKIVEAYARGTAQAPVTSTPSMNTRIPTRPSRIAPPRFSLG